MEWNFGSYKIKQNVLHRKSRHVFETETSRIYVYTHQKVMSRLEALAY